MNGLPSWHPVLKRLSEIEKEIKALSARLDRLEKDLPAQPAEEEPGMEKRLKEKIDLLSQSVGERKKEDLGEEEAPRELSANMHKSPQVSLDPSRRQHRLHVLDSIGSRDLPARLH